ncbi:hypothetical protein LWI29_001892 [Acer saccharum]|uniref:Uncharacterized protein n=1 Tax=Acer saccharum TaxID=4024 RepID=A0AA39RJT6_ACESA|nr:hypothetical protein LWI29_001892 [Acer saccharum]
MQTQEFYRHEQEAEVEDVRVDVAAMRTQFGYQTYQRRERHRRPPPPPPPSTGTLGFSAVDYVPDDMTPADIEKMRRGQSSRETDRRSPSVAQIETANRDRRSPSSVLLAARRPRRPTFVVLDGRTFVVLVGRSFVVLVGRTFSDRETLGLLIVLTSVVLAVATISCLVAISFLASREIPCLVTAVQEMMENMNYEDFLLKPKDKWITKSTTNVYCNLNGLPDIVKVLRKVGDLAAFRRTCFGHLIDIPKDLTFSAGVLHNLLLRQVHVPACILEELHPTVNEREQPYLEGIDTNLSDGPQFVPDNLEEDDGREGVDFEVGNDDNDGGQSRPQQKKRKRSPRKQKITPNTKRQRTSGDTSPVGDESTVSSQTRQLMKEMSDRFEDIVKKEISAMERRIKRRLTRVEKSVDQLVDARREVTNLFSFLTGM